MSHYGISVSPVKYVDLAATILAQESTKRTYIYLTNSGIKVSHKDLLKRKEPPARSRRRWPMARTSGAYYLTPDRAIFIKFDSIYPNIKEAIHLYPRHCSLPCSRNLYEDNGTKSWVEVDSKKRMEAVLCYLAYGNEPGRLTSYRGNAMGSIPKGLLLTRFQKAIKERKADYHKSLIEDRARKRENSVIQDQFAIKLATYQKKFETDEKKTEKKKKKLKCRPVKEKIWRKPTSTSSTTDTINW